MTSFWW